MLTALWYHLKRSWIFGLLLWSRWHSLTFLNWAASKEELACCGIVWVCLAVLQMSWTSCVIPQPSYWNQTWLNTYPQETAPSYTNNGCYSFWDSACPKNMFIHGTTSSHTFTFFSTVYMHNIAGASTNIIHIVVRTISTWLLKLSYGSKTSTV